MGDLLERIKELIAPLFKDQDMVLVELKLIRQGNRLTLRFLADRTKGGITIEECAKLNEQISQVLDAQELFLESYFLEVSSPGVDRPVVSLDDFHRVIGREMRLFFREPVKNKKELVATLDKIEGNALAFILDLENIEIPIENILRAKQII